MASTTEGLRSTYFEIYGTPKDDADAIGTICDVFKERITNGTISMETKEGIGEYYRLLQERDLPAFEWIMEAVHVVSKKNPDKHTFAYIIGILRDWMKYGFGHMPSDEERELLDYFCEITGLQESDITLEAHRIMQKTMGEYGAMKMMRLMPVLKEEVSMDWSRVKAMALREKLEERFGCVDTKPRVQSY